MTRFVDSLIFVAGFDSLFLVIVKQVNAIFNVLRDQRLIHQRLRMKNYSLQ